MKKNSNIFQKWLKKLYASGKSDHEVGKILSGVAKLSSIYIYEAIMTSLTQDDIKKVEKITDDEKAKKKIEKLFKEKTGMSIDDLVREVQEYLLT